MREIDPTSAAELQRNAPDSTVFLDVREDSEIAICRIEGALHIPMGEIPERYESLPKKENLVVFCHHGMRSANVIQFLAAKGVTNTLNLSGGIHAWAIEVDPQMKQY